MSMFSKVSCWGPQRKKLTHTYYYTSNHYVHRILCKPWSLIIFVCAQSGHGERRGRAPELIAPEYLQGAQCSTWSGVQRLALLFCSLCRQARFRRHESSI